MSCANLSEKDLSELGSQSEAWYCKDCKAECGLCSGAVLNDHNAVQCDKCERWVHNDCSFVTDFDYKPMQIQVAPGFVQNVNFQLLRFLLFRAAKLGRSKQIQFFS